MRLGDYVVLVSMSLNLLAALAYARQGHWLNVFYWLAALQIIVCAMRLR